MRERAVTNSRDGSFGLFVMAMGIDRPCQQSSDAGQSDIRRNPNCSQARHHQDELPSNCPDNLVNGSAGEDGVMVECWWVGHKHLFQLIKELELKSQLSPMVLTCPDIRRVLKTYHADLQ